MLTFPKDTREFSWTRHIKNKMVFYHLSGTQILRIFRKPDRIEEGVAPETIAAMQTKKSLGANTPRQEEIWIMYRVNKGLRTKNKEREQKSSGSIPQSLVLSSKSRITLISAWRYPGITKPGDRLPIPVEIAEELARGIY